MLFCVVVVFVALFSLVDCSNVQLEGRIVGGKNTKINNYPYQVSVRLSDKHICGGAVISNDTILTATHCTIRQNQTLFSIRHGSTYADYGIKHEVIRIIQNPGFNSDYNEYDSCLLKIKPAIKFTRRSQPARLAEKRSADNSEAIMCGWGVPYEDADTDNLGKKSMRCITVRTVNQQVCQLNHHTLRIGKTLMCAASKGKDGCQGDSGGALLDKRKRQVIGISSWGDGCAKPDRPGVYGSVPDMLKFIKENL